ncbi:MAG: replication initiator protein A, partial [Clostridia bacterium]|nr:replication initiator protein A [Clostridia bacterium]
MHDYIYSIEPERFSFIRVPKILLQNEAYSGISAEAKLLYSLLFDRTELSNKNGWLDDQNRVYIIFTIAEIKECMNCGNKKAIQLLDELENKAGLIERKRQGLGKPNLIYVKSFFRTVDKYGERHFLKCQNDTSGSMKMTPQEVSESHSTNTDNKKTDMNHTDPSFLPGRESKRSDDYEQYESYFRSELEIPILILNSPTERETLEGIVDLLAETCSSKRKTIRIAGDDKPIEVVKSRLMKLNSMHIQFVLDCLKENTTYVRDMKQYLLTTLFNAPVTIDPYYQANMLFKSIFYSAQYSNRIRDNPTAKINAKGGVPKKDKEALSDAQAKLLLDTIRDLPPYVFVMIGLYSGLR